MQVTHLSQIHILMINNFGPPTHQYETKSNMKNKNFELKMTKVKITKNFQ